MINVMIGKFKYTTKIDLKENLVRVVGYKKGVKNVKIPRNIFYEGEEYRVCELTNSVFKDCSHLKSISIPETVDKVCSECFLNCTNLKKVKVFSTSTIFEDDVFKGCTKLIDYQGLVVIGCDNFFNQELSVVAYYGDKEFIEIPEGVTRILNLTFAENKIIKYIKFPSTLKSIGHSAFYNCESLTRAELPDNIDVIEIRTFSRCKSLKKVVLPLNLREIKEEAFSHCEKLTFIEWGTILKVIGVNAFLNCTLLKTLHFPEGLREIKTSAFASCINLTEVYIPTSLSSIGFKCFIECENLAEVIFAPHEDMLLCNYRSFSYTKKMCENLLLNGKELTVQVVEGFDEDDVISYRHDQIKRWEVLSHKSKNIFIDEWQKKISSETILGENTLRNLVFLKSNAKEMLTYFNENCNLELLELDLYLKYSIENNNTVETAILLEYKEKNFDIEYLKEYENHKELVEIGLELPTFNELCENWEVHLRENYIVIVKYKGEQTSVIIPEAIDTGFPIAVISTKEKGAFNPIKQLVLPNNLIMTIGNCFYDCVLEEVVLPKHLTKIKLNMFDGASKLKQIELHEGIELIAENAFRKCCELKEVCFPASLTNIKNNAFEGCIDLEKVVFLDSVNCTESTKEIDEKAFLDCPNLKEVILSKNFTEIPDKVFENCTALEFVGYADGVNLLKKE